MKRMIVGLVGIAAVGLTSPTFADATDGMVGKWQWEAFTVDCNKGGTHGMTCVVATGPKNVGLEMIQSPLTQNGEAFVGKIAHPMTGETYNTKIMGDGPDAFRLDGCTAAGACASGVFTRVK